MHSCVRVIVAGAPEFARPAYAVYRAGGEDDAMADALRLLRQSAAEEAEDDAGAG